MELRPQRSFIGRSTTMPCTGIAYAFKNPVAVAKSGDDPEDDRTTYLVRVRRDDLAEALTKSTSGSSKIPGPSGIHAYGFLRALSREGLSERKAGDEERR